MSCVVMFVEQASLIPVYSNHRRMDLEFGLADTWLASYALMVDNRWHIYAVPMTDSIVLCLLCCSVDYC